MLGSLLHRHLLFANDYLLHLHDNICIIALSQRPDRILLSFKIFTRHRPAILAHQGQWRFRFGTDSRKPGRELSLVISHTTTTVPKPIVKQPIWQYATAHARPTPKRQFQAFEEQFGPIGTINAPSRHPQRGYENRALTIWHRHNYQSRLSICRCSHRGAIYQCR